MINILLNILITNQIPKQIVLTFTEKHIVTKFKFSWGKYIFSHEIEIEFPLCQFV